MSTLFLLLVVQGGAWLPSWQAPSLDFQCPLIAIPDRDGDGRSEVLIGYPDLGLLDILSGATGASLLQIPSPASGHTGFGYGLARLGDLDQDNYEDFAVGAPLDSRLGVYSHGAIYVLSGRAGTVLGTTLGSQQYESLGWSLYPAGDLDGDGWADLLATARSTTSSTATAIRAVSSRTGSVLYLLDPPASESGFGAAAADLPDRDGDLVADFVLSAATADPGGVTDAGWIGFYSGRTGALFAERAGTLPQQGLGYLLTSVGDLDGDRLHELLVTGTGATGSSPQGMVLSGRDGSVRLWVDADPIRQESWSAAGGGVDFDGDGDLELFVADKFASRPGEFWNGRISILSADTGLVEQEIWGEPSLQFGQAAVVADAVGLAGRPGILCKSSAPLAPLIWSWSFEDLLRASALSVSAQAGGQVMLDLAFPLSEAGKSYLLLGSGSGGGPTNFGGIEVALTRDALYQRMLTGSPPIFRGARGVLDAGGQASAGIALAPGVALPHVGRTFRFAAVSYAGVLARLASHAVELTILP